MKGRAHCLVLSTILKVISYHPYSKAVKMKNEQNVPQITLSSFYCDKIQSGSLDTTIYTLTFWYKASYSRVGGNAAVVLRVSLE